MISVTGMSHCCSQLSRLHSQNTPCKQTHMHSDGLFPALRGRRWVHGLRGIERSRCEVLSSLVWSRPHSLCLGLGECLALDKAVFEEGLQMLVYYRLSCHATDKASEKLLSPGPRHTQTHTHREDKCLQEEFTLRQRCAFGQRRCQSSAIFRPWLMSARLVSDSMFYAVHLSW